MDQLSAWAAEHGVAITSVAVAALIIVRVLRRAIPAGIARAVLRDATPLTESDLRKRADTLSSVLLGSAQVMVLILALLLIVEELGVNVAPVIAGLGIGGIAVGLGAQSLVKDAITGGFILFENQFGKGDMVRVGGVQGWVEDVNLRRTLLRDADGTLHTVPNSEIKVASNLTRGFSGVNVLISVAAATDIDQVTTLVDGVGAAMAADPDLGGTIVDPPRVTVVENVSAAAVTLRVVGRVVPGAQWEATSVLRRRLMRAFTEAGIAFGPVEATPPPPAPVAAAPPPVRNR